MTSLRIKAVKAVFDERILDRWGTSFKFDHAKGLAEWLKNSVDAYIREGTLDDFQFIYLRFLSKSQDSPVKFETIDFVGMTHEDIEKAFKRWGDPDAASKKGKFKTYGGHGNGGKFYMRQMFNSSRFVTYRDGRINIFGFNEKKKYGFADGYEDVKMSARKAMDIAGIREISLPDPIKKRFDDGDVRFTVVVGEGPRRYGRNTVPRVLQRLSVHPQARKIIEHEPVLVLIDSQSDGTRLAPTKFNPRPNFEGPFDYQMPKELTLGGTVVEMSNDRYSPGRLLLRTSEEPFGRYGERSMLNCVDIVAGLGVVASYRLNELGFFTHQIETEFIYGECECPILVDPEDDCVTNDREKLVENERTKALLEWIREKVDELAGKMAEQNAANKREQDLKQSSVFNDFLNRWKNRFMAKLYAEIFSGPGAGPGAGGTGGGGGPAGGKGHGDQARAGEEGSEGGGSGDQKRKAPRFPQVLLSNQDLDPLNPSQKVNCDPRHPPVYQRPDDVREGIYWINTRAPFAEKIIEKYGAESPRWREYMFQRYVDIITKQAIYEKAKKEPELSPGTVDGLLDDVARRVYSSASDDLYNFLFKEQLTPNTVIEEKQEQV